MVTKLHEYLASAGLSQSEFARATGIPTPMISCWVNAKRRPGLANALAIQEATKGAIPAAYWRDIAVESDPPRSGPRAPRRARRVSRARRAVNSDLPGGR